MRARWSNLARAALLSLGAIWTTGANAHSMPDTQVVVDRSAQGVTLYLQAPVEDLALALGRPVAPEDHATLHSYFVAHTRIETAAGHPLPVEIIRIDLVEDHHADVGQFSEVQVTATAPADAEATLILRYDGILHEVANHRALVYAPDGTRLGILRFDLAKKAPTTLTLVPLSDK